MCGINNNHQWPFQEPKLEVPTIYKAYIGFPLKSSSNIAGCWGWNFLDCADTPAWTPSLPKVQTLSGCSMIPPEFPGTFVFLFVWKSSTPKSICRESISQFAINWGYMFLRVQTNFRPISSIFPNDPPTIIPMIPSHWRPPCHCHKGLVAISFHCQWLFSESSSINLGCMIHPVHLHWPLVLSCYCIVSPFVPFFSSSLMVNPHSILDTVPSG